MVSHCYDLANNRTFRRDVAASLANKHFDELYTYDGMHRLKTATRGQLYQDNAGMVGTTTFGQTWQLDQTGNWDRFTEYDNQGASFGALDQTRTQNEANEIEKITLLAGQEWYQPGYDRNGNMTTMPQPAAPNNGYDATYDAWNRLVRLNIAGTETKAAEYQYDAMHRRTVWNNYISGSWELHFFYSDSWQILEQRYGSPTNVPANQWVWGLRYIDDLAFRDEGITSGPLQRLYALQDANWNVTAFTDATGAVIQRLAYDPYGTSTELNANFTPYTGPTNYNWEFRFTGQKYDKTSGLYVFRARYYHDTIGRFVSRDPTNSLESTRPLYEYAFGNPLGAVDPLGHFAIAVAFNAFIPKSKGQSVVSIAAEEKSVSNVKWGVEPGQIYVFEAYMFATDDREEAGEKGTSRVYLTGRFDSESLGSLKGTKVFSATAGASHQILAAFANRIPVYKKGSLRTKTAKATLGERITDYDAKTCFDVSAEAAYPFSSVAPSIDYGMTACFGRRADGSVRFHAVGEHNEFPAYEILINGDVVYKFHPSSSGPGLFNLGFFTDSFHIAGTISSDGKKVTVDD